MKAIVNQLNPLAQQPENASTLFAGGSPLSAEDRLKPRLVRRKTGQHGRAFPFQNTEEA